jgi:acyl carrier protein
LNPEAVLEVMRAFFKDRDPAPSAEEFSELKPPALLKESIDVVDFIVYLEEELGAEIPTGEIGEAIVSMNFRELSEALAVRLAP